MLSDARLVRMEGKLDQILELLAHMQANVVTRADFQASVRRHEIFAGASIGIVSMALAILIMVNHLLHQQPAAPAPTASVVIQFLPAGPPATTGMSPRQ